jgi:RNA polymerase sigma factor (TIGR02999 family)
MPESTSPNAVEVTRLLSRAQSGDAKATNDLFPFVYDELRELAGRFLAGERAGHTLQPTALVNEAYMRLVGPGGTQWENRAHFFGAAAQAIRRILTDHARAKQSLKRGGSAKRVGLDDISDVVPEQGVRIDEDGPDFVAIDRALEKLAKIDEGKAKVVELRFFAGLTVDQTAAALGVSPSTVARDWQFARLWLHRELAGEGGA